MGSVKGTPISIISTPLEVNNFINSIVVSISGSPATKYPTSAFLLLFFRLDNFFVNLFKA